MGKSDHFIFKEYLDVLKGIESNATAFLGFIGENDFTKNVPGKTRHFYDRQLGNWDINSNWALPQKYDLIVCTRCAYFSKNPDVFIQKCRNSLNNGGHALIDWGLGDHWRFKNFKVGWVRGGEHEFAYSETNFLHSCFWNDFLEDDEEVKKFWHYAKLVGLYRGNDEISNIIASEVPKITSYETKLLRTKFLWPESPQLYIITLISS